MARKGFQYKRRSKESLRQRAEQSSGSYDRLTKDGIPTMSVKEGSYQLRIMPPTWPDADHYGYEVFVHYGVGPDNGQYLCPAKMDGSYCPICEERRTASEDDAKSLAPKKRVMVWVIDRDHEEDGPKLWSMPWTIDQDLAKQADDPRSGEILYIDDPDEGYDIAFTKEGTGLKTQYRGLKILHRDSPLHKKPAVVEEWLDFILEHQIPDCLNLYSGKYIEQVFAGLGGEEEEPVVQEEEEPVVQEEETEEEEPPHRRSRKRYEDEEEEYARPRRARKREVEDEDEEEDGKAGREHLKKQLNKLYDDGE